MDRNELQEILEQPYSREVFENISKEILPFQLFTYPQDFKFDEKYASDVDKLTVLGEANISNRKIYLIEVKLNKKSIEHSPVYQRYVVAKFLESSLADASVAAFYTENKEEWRYSLVDIEYKFGKNQKVEKEVIGVKRHSFIVGKRTHLHTAVEQISKLYGNNNTFEDVMKAFSIEPATEEFYKGIVKFYDRLMHDNELQIPSNAEEVAKEAFGTIPDPVNELKKIFSIRLFDKLIFSWFLKKKVINGKPIIPEEILSSSAVSTNYYHNVIEKLFFEVMNIPEEQRKPDIRNSRVWNSIPYLNGGLFQPLKEDFYNGESNQELKISNAWFKDLFKFFEEYNFTVSENDPMDIEVSVDPEMLGRIFENLVAQMVAPESQKSAKKATGSYYTPRVVVDYMVKESLKYYLINKTGISEEKIEKVLGDYTEDIELTDEGKKKIVKALYELKILDSAVGSGAFPISMLHRMVRVLQKADPDCKIWRNLLIKDLQDEEEIEHLVSESNNYKRKYGILKNIIYGVDIQPIAVEIARLRAFLTLVIDAQKEVKPLPNLEFKFVAANRLISLPEEELGLYTDDKKLEELERLRERYFVSHSKEKEQLVKEYKAKLHELIKESSGDKSYLTGRQKMILSWDPFNSSRAAGWFDPFWMFGVKEDDGMGFDIVIGNPPYGISFGEREKKYFKEHYKATGIKIINTNSKLKGSIDSFAIFIEKGLNLLKKNGILNYIVPISITSSDSMQALHSIIESQCETIFMSSYSDRPQQIFKNASTKVSIILLHKTNTPCKNLFMTKMYRKSKEKGIDKIIKELKFIDAKNYRLIGRYPRTSLRMEKYILEKIFSQKYTISNFLDSKGKPIYYRTAGGRYFVIVTNYATGSTQEKPLYIIPKFADYIGAVLSSNLFFWFYQVYSDLRHIKINDLKSFRFPKNKLSDSQLKEIENVYEEYLNDIENNAILHKTINYANIDSFREYKIAKSKHLIDKIDDIIGPLYGLTPEEIDFVKKYEIEFRMAGVK